ncbi:5-hydroxytryptamine receptor 4 [Lingula anatina]|uniref:5-hydroxytryptamine receptor 4 n=1 Tax=Lingula anatina TaxID=7574 RepID=A0A1S3K9S7_LINAN|nr:5-hydroxytryptamine receptor 4 [Lingula anatina]XP_013419253.1 5-hydroxytryptamine receptor 4 [Lingula anatina]|eukprot:XP_013419252.1 5-hydroxytryptamine receptor 4 [Lingula anatina]
MMEEDGFTQMKLLTNANVAFGFNNGCYDDELAGSPIHYSVAERTLLGIFLVLVIVLTILGNVVISMAVVFFKSLRTYTNCFVVSLAVADILVAVLVMPFGMYHQVMNEVWELGDAMCRVASSFDVMFTTSSILHLSCLAADRYFAICCPFYYHGRMTRRKVIILLVMCWTLPIIISFIPIMNRWNTIGIEDAIKAKTPPGTPICMFLVNIPYSVVGSILAFYIPVCFMIVVNVKIYSVARRQVRQIRTIQLSIPGPAKKFKCKEAKAAKTLAVVMGGFGVCWGPFFVLNVIDPFIHYSIPYKLWTTAIWLGYVNSTLNPFLYFFFNRGFRKAITHLLNCDSCSRFRVPEDEAHLAHFIQPSRDSSGRTSADARTPEDGLKIHHNNTVCTLHPEHCPL